jgi:hypothetical protein
MLKLQRPRQPSGFLAEHPPSPDLKIRPLKGPRGQEIRHIRNPSYVAVTREYIDIYIYRLYIYILAISVLPNINLQKWGP